MKKKNILVERPEIDLGQSKKLKITKENFQILKNAGLLTQVQGKSWQQFFGTEPEKPKSYRVSHGAPRIYYAIQTICGGDNAEGGGCGGPRGVKFVDRQKFESFPGKEYQGLQQHSCKEVGISPESDIVVKLNFEPCRSCAKKY